MKSEKNLKNEKNEKSKSVKKDKKKVKKSAKEPPVQQGAAPQATPIITQADSLQAPSLPEGKNGEAPLITAVDPLAYVVKTVGGKWKMRILWCLREQTERRYGDIRREIPGITDMMLSQSLRELAADQLVERRQYQEIPPRVEYMLTPKGAGILPALEQLALWAAKAEQNTTHKG